MKTKEELKVIGLEMFDVLEKYKLSWKEFMIIKIVLDESIKRYIENNELYKNQDGTFRINQSSVLLILIAVTLFFHDCDDE